MNSLRFLFEHKPKLPGKGLLSGNLEKCCEVELQFGLDCNLGSKNMKGKSDLVVRMESVVGGL